jgi:LDH2 family malate/lactate/ureidoglycolate dehydrogenase
MAFFGSPVMCACSSAGNSIRAPTSRCWSADRDRAVDGDNGMGHLVMTYAANLSVEIAREAGVAWVGIRRSNHSGAGSTYATIRSRTHGRHLQRGLVVVDFMAPWAAPSPCSAPTRSRRDPGGQAAADRARYCHLGRVECAIRTYANEGRPLPVAGSINREDGEPITEASASPGMFVPSAPTKAPACDRARLLGGPLKPRRIRARRQGHDAEQVKETNTGHLMIALDVKRFLPLDTFKAEIDRHVHDLSTSKRLPGVDEIRIPGQDA